MRVISQINNKGILATSQKEKQQLAKSWSESQKKLERKIVSEKNKKQKAKLEIYHTFFLNNEFDSKQGTIKEKTPDKRTKCLGLRTEWD